MKLLEGVRLPRTLTIVSTVLWIAAAFYLAAGWKSVFGIIGILAIFMQTAAVNAARRFGSVTHE